MSKENDKLQDTLVKLEQGVRDFFDSEHFKDYLKTMSKFHSYSLNNQILIAMQRPDATLIAGYNSWIKNFSRHVKQNEKAITIIAPQKHIVEVETDKADEYGNALTEKKEYISFRPVSVFDISQTDGEPLPKLLEELKGDVNNYNEFMQAVQTASPFDISIHDVSSEEKGWCDIAQNQIVIKSGMSELQTIKTAIHETAHARLHADKFKDRERSSMEIEAESIAYVVCEHYGLDTSDYSFGYIASWAADKNVSQLKESLQIIRNESKDIINVIDECFRIRNEKINGVPVTYIEEKAADTVRNVLHEMNSGSTVVAARVYGSYQLPDEPRKANVLVEYSGEEREDGLFNAIHEDRQIIDGIELDINPIKADKSGNINEYYDNLKRLEQQEMLDDTWPMIKVTYSSYDGIHLGRMNIYDAKKSIDEAEERIWMTGRKGDFLRINVAYTYEGHKCESTDIVILGEGRRNFIDYLSVPAQIITFLHRHEQLLDTVNKARTSNAIAPGTKAQADYEDMMLKWAEEQRKELNYHSVPDIKRPPNFNPLVEQYKDWEVAR